MSYMAVGREDIALGTPLPWDVCDEDGKPLMKQGAVLETEAALQALLARNPMRELALDIEEAASGAEQDAGETGNKTGGKTHDASLAEAAEGADPGFTFQDMRLRPGDRIHLQPPPRLGQERYAVKLIGYVDNTTLLVTAPMDNGLRVPLEEEDEVIARIFSSQKAFGFSSVVRRICNLPIRYLHLSFPERIQASVIRKSPRVRTNIIASITQPDPGDTGAARERKSGVIVDLSGDGAAVKTPQAVGDKGQTIRLVFRVNLHDIDAQLGVQGIIRSTPADAGNGHGNDAMLNYGIQFQNLVPNDRMILQSFIYQQMIEQPHSVT